MNNTECNKIFVDTVNMTGTSTYTLFKLAQCFISGYDLKKLRDMLSSDDDGAVLDALFICKEIGRLVCQVSEHIGSLRNSQDEDIRKMADEVAGVCDLYGCE